MITYDPNTFDKVEDPKSNHTCTKCGKKSLALYDHNGIGRIANSCFVCKNNSAYNDLNDIF